MKNIIYTGIFLCIYLSSLSSEAQTNSSHWYFGNNAGIVFKDGSVSSLTDGAMATVEGCASISTNDGKLLFYTNGVTVWGKNHIPLPNGTGLNGNESSSQSALIVPLHNKPGQFYIFTSDYQGGNKGLSYSVIDMSLNNGFGDITQKNIPLLASCSEKIAAVKDPLNKRVWVVAHEWNSNRFFSFPVDTTGINPPVISATGSIHGGDDPSNSLGCMKISADGSKLALAIFGTNTIEICNFDKGTGQVSNPRKMQYTNYIGPYGIEFSPNGNFLYVSFTGNTDILSVLIQYNLSLEDPDLMKRSAFVIHKRKYPSSLSSLQRGTNGKIYASIKNWTYLAAIENPDISNNSCNFTTTGVYLGSKKCTYGLPNLISEPVKKVTAVPLENESLLVKKQKGCVLLEWTTAIPRNYSFLIERASNSSEFTELTEIKADGTTTRFEYIDTAPGEGILYYRVVAIDENGLQYSYPAGSVEYSASKDLIIRNPVRPGESFLPGEPSIAYGKIFNLKGELVADQASHAPSAPGAYIIIIDKAPYRLQVIN